MEHENGGFDYQSVRYNQSLLHDFLRMRRPAETGHRVVYQLCPRYLRRIFLDVCLHNVT